MKGTERANRICPICGAEYAEIPAVSRVDNRTPICPTCGTREALAGLGIGKEEQDHIIETIRRHIAGREG